MFQNILMKMCKHWLPLCMLELMNFLRGRFLYLKKGKELFAYAERNEEFKALHKEELEYIRKHKVVDVFNYEWSRRNKCSQIQVFYDKLKKIHYVLIDDGRKLYYPRNWCKAWIQYVHKALLVEAMKKSPHKYFDDNSMPEKGTVFLDIGGAEGIISLQVVERVKQVVIFECNSEWVTALNATFEPYIDKVKIVNKYVSDKTEGMSISLDDFIAKEYAEEENFFIKCDIEGSEMKFLEGAQRTLREKHVKLVICTYHGDHDEADIEAFIRKEGILNYSKSENYMVFPLSTGTFREPYFKRGLIKVDSDG